MLLAPDHAAAPGIAQCLAFRYRLDFAQSTVSLDACSIFITGNRKYKKVK